MYGCGGAVTDSESDPQPPNTTPNPTNAPPLLEWVSPTQNEVLSAGSQINIELAASDSDGSISSVSLFIDDELVGEDTDSPYVWSDSLQTPFPNLSDLSAGQYILAAIATDNQGLQTSIQTTLTISSAPSTTIIRDVKTAQRFMSFAGFGASKQTLEAMVNTDAADWLANQFAMPYDSYLESIRSRLVIQDDPENRGSTTSTQRYHLQMFWDKVLGGEDVLRQRMLFALSQIIVANENNQRQAHREAYYLDLLGQNAFGNYKNILTEITYSPLMGRYLTYINNRAGDPSTGRLPDENYAREILQLFTIGLVELELNGELTLANGAPIETYDNEDVVNLARVFTGLRFDANELGTAAHYTPMEMNERNHSKLEKNFLNTSIPANTDGRTSIQLAIDGIFSHKNVAPFIARQLIQRFTASHPSANYIERVATAFETGEFIADNALIFGDGARGNLEATLAAILLEPSLFNPVDEPSNNITNGKIREPVLRFAHWARAFKVFNVNSAIERRLNNTTSTSSSLGQQPFRSPSVFNFYRPGYIAPGSNSGSMGLTAPEFQLVNTATAIGYTNFMTDFIVDNTATTTGENAFIPDYTDEMALADDAGALVEHLALILTGGRMTNDSQQLIIDAVESIELRASSIQEDKQSRVHLAIIMAVNDPSFAVVY